MQHYAVALVIDPDGEDESTRASIEFGALDDVDAEKKAREWADGLHDEGDWLIITHNGRGIRPVKLKSSH